MYIPEYYKNENIEQVKEFLKENSFGILVNQNQGRLMGTHIPMLLEKEANGKDVLVSHISKLNLQLNDFDTTKEVLAIFNGPHSYVSSSWYKEEEVPTWDYIAVHVYGTLRILSDEELLASLKRLVNKYEQDSEHPVAIEHLSPKTMRQQKGIVGFSLQINEIQACKKISQTRTEEDLQNIVHHLSNSTDNGAQSIAKEMCDFAKKKKG